MGRSPFHIQAHHSPISMKESIRHRTHTLFFICIDIDPGYFSSSSRNPWLSHLIVGSQSHYLSQNLCLRMSQRNHNSLFHCETSPWIHSHLRIVQWSRTTPLRALTCLSFFCMSYFYEGISLKVSGNATFRSKNTRIL